MHKLYFFIVAIWITGCQPAEKKPAEEEIPTERAETPVTVSGISYEPLANYAELNATTSFLQKSFVKANANGYLQSNFTRPGQYVSRGQLLFTITTKEAKSLGNAVNALDSSFRFSGTNNIRAEEQGFITQLNHQAGDYVQDGEQLAVISNKNSFAFLLDLPYELRPIVKQRQTVELTLPDGEKFTGQIAGEMPAVDPTAQTQSVFIKINASQDIPENLIAKVRIAKTTPHSVVSVPRTAVLSDETQSAFWIMKMIDSSTAVKTPVTKGLETPERIEILSPRLTASDRIIVSGNYGLSDTARVKIVQP